MFFKLENYTKPYIIAEAGINHDGKIKNAFKLIDIAKKVGADCVKFQAFTAKDLTIKPNRRTKYQKQKSQYQILLKYELKKNDFKKIKEYCDYKHIDFLITPFSPWWVETFSELGVKIFKISSGSLRSLNLLREIGKTKLTVILSTGMCNINDVKNAVDILRDNGCKNLFILHCVSLYPTKLEQINLFAMHVLRNEFNVSIGFSDHTIEVTTGELAVAAGAVILEKHFTINREGSSPDHKLSLTPRGLKRYIEKSKKAAVICGEEKKEPIEEELKMKEKIQCSLVTKKFIKKGEIISYDKIVEKRPGTGISPFDINKIIGCAVSVDIEADEILTYQHFN